MFGPNPTSNKPIQLYHWTLDGGECVLDTPNSKLIPYVHFYWLLTISAPSLNLEVIPDTAVDLVLSPTMPDFAALYFPVNEKFQLPLQGPIQYAGICFKSTTATDLLDHDLDQLRDLSFGSDTISTIDISSLISAAQGLRSMADFSRVFDQFWLQRITPQKPRPQPTRTLSHAELMVAVEESMGAGSIPSICKALAISERQFRRVSNELFGLSPKKLQNVLRLQSALTELLTADSRQLQNYYYDDSHRIRELKRLTGFTPKELRGMAEKYNN